MSSSRETSSARDPSGKKSPKNPPKRNLPVPRPASVVAVASSSCAGEGPSSSGIRPDPKLLEQLVCPITRAPLEYDAACQELISRSARLAYPIRDGIPIMLPEEARVLPG